MKSMLLILMLCLCGLNLAKLSSIKNLSQQNKTESKSIQSPPIMSNNPIQFTGPIQSTVFTQSTPIQSTGLIKPLRSFQTGGSSITRTKKNLRKRVSATPRFLEVLKARRSLSTSNNMDRSWKQLSAYCPMMTTKEPPTAPTLVPPQNVRAFCEPGLATVFFDIPPSANGWLYRVVSENDNTITNLTSCGVARISGMAPASIHQFKVYSVSFLKTNSSSSVLSNQVRCDETPPIPLNVKLETTLSTVKLIWNTPMFRMNTITSVKVILNPGNTVFTGTATTTQISLTSGVIYDGRLYTATLVYVNTNGDSLSVVKTFSSAREVVVESGEVFTLSPGPKIVYKSLWIKAGATCNALGGKVHLALETLKLDGVMKAKDVFIQAIEAGEDKLKQFSENGDKLSKEAYSKNIIIDGLLKLTTKTTLILKMIKKTSMSFI